MTDSQGIGSARATDAARIAFAPMSARRVLALGGIGLILVGMLVGDIFAVFVLHQNAAKVGESLSAAAHATMAGDADGVSASFRSVGSFLENRGTKVDTHVHMIAFGYLALMLAILHPWVALRESTRKKVAWIFLIGAWLLPVGVFLIHYVGLRYRPLKEIGWASILADFGGALVIVATLACVFGIARHFAQRQRPPLDDALLKDRSATGRILSAGGLALILLGFLHGAYYAGADLYRHEARDYSLLSQMTVTAAARNATALGRALAEYGQLGGEKAVNIAAHAHAIEFGLLAMLLAFFQPYVNLRDAWKRNWAWVLLLGSLGLPVFVLLELKLGLLAGGSADVSGLLVMIALLAMCIGIVRYTGEIDASLSLERRGKAMSAAQRLLIVGGIALALLGMIYGVWYAVFAEHQELDGMGKSLTMSFSGAAKRDPVAAEAALQQYKEFKYSYDRHVDAHGHWIGLAMVLVVLGIGLERVGLNERITTLLASGLLLGSFLFPLGVLLQTFSHGQAPRVLAIVGSALVIVSLAGMTVGFAVGSAKD